MLSSRFRFWYGGDCSSREKRLFAVVASYTPHRCDGFVILLQIVLDEAFPDLLEQGSSADVRTAIEQPNNLLAVSLLTALQLRE